MSIAELVRSPSLNNGLKNNDDDETINPELVGNSWFYEFAGSDEIFQFDEISWFD